MLDFLKSNDLKNDMARILKKDVSNIDENDLSIIKEISLKKQNIFDERMDYNISDLQYLNGLEYCTISGFDIFDEDISILNNLSTLEYLKFDFCKFMLDMSTINNTNLKELLLDKCEKTRIGFVTSPNLIRLQCVGFKEEWNTLDFGESIYLNELNNLSINNYQLKNVTKILENWTNLKKINFDGSKIPENEIEKLSSTEIEISNKSAFYLH